MNCHSNFYKEISLIGSEDDLDTVAFDLSREHQLEGHALCELENHHSQDGVEHRLSMISCRPEKFDRKKLIDDQALYISELAKYPTTPLTPYIWEESGRQWVQFLNSDRSPVQKNSKYVNLALFVPANPNKVICLLAIGVYMQPGRIETAYFQSTASMIIAKHLSLTNPIQSVDLSHGERLCLVWAASGKGVSEIATMLSLSEHTISHYFSMVCSKLQAKTRSQAVVKAIKLGLIGLHEIG